MTHDDAHTSEPSRPANQSHQGYGLAPVVHGLQAFMDITPTATRDELELHRAATVPIVDAPDVAAREPGGVESFSWDLDDYYDAVFADEDAALLAEINGAPRPGPQPTMTMGQVEKGQLEKSAA